MLKKLSGLEHFWKMGLAKCARNCSESSISHTNRKTLTRSKHFWKMRSAKCAHKNCKKMSRSEHFWKMRWVKCARDWSESSISHKNCKKLYQRWPQTDVENLNYILACGKGYHVGILPCIYCPPCPMHPKEPRVGDKCGRQVWETSVGDKRETSVNSCGPRNPEWETSVGNKCGKQVWETSVRDKCGRQVWKTSGRQV